MFADDTQSTFAQRFALEREAGVGGMGIVYRAFDRVSQRTVALKVLRKVDATAARRFAAEANAIGSLDHPAIVSYLAHGISEHGEPYLAMEWIEGTSLSARLARMAATREYVGLFDVLELGRRLADALSEAHARGIVHRDVKPGNILLADDRIDRPKLADFGIVRADFATHRTTSGVVVGTVGYMAPEQARGDDDLDERADLFALGCVLFRCLTNVEAFPGTEPVMVLSKLLLDDPPHVGELRHGVPLALDTLVARLLAKDRALRPSSAAVVRDEMNRIAARLRDPTRLPPIYAPASRPAGAKRPWPAHATRALRLILALGALAVWLVALMAHFRSHAQPTPAHLQPPADAADAPTAITDLPAAPSCAPAAVEAYEHGLQALREAGWVHAHRLFEGAAIIDPSCPQVQFRLVLTGEKRYPMVSEREQIRRALQLRDDLSERDRALLDAWTAALASGVPREAEAVRLLDEAARRFPRDAEVLLLTALRRLNLAPHRDGLEAALDLARRASFVDPGYADAWNLQALILGYLGRDEDKLAAVQRCIEVAPGALDCIEERMHIFRQRGQCAEAAEEARRRIALEPNDARTYYQLAGALASSGASAEAIDEALLRRWSLLSPEKREWMMLTERAKLAAWRGDFERVLAAAAELAQLADRTANVDAQLRRAVIAVDAFLEVGRGTDAGLAAHRFLQGEKVWVKGDSSIIGVTYYDALFLAAEVQSGKLSPAAWYDASDAWEHSNRTRANDAERWALRWGTAIGTHIAPAEALQHMPPLELRRTMRASPLLAPLTGVMDGYEGRVHLYTGDLRTASSLLERSARSCNSLDFPFLNIRTHLWLGMANEKRGDTTAACDAYRFVLDRWGTSKVPSVTAAEAKRRSLALGCKTATRAVTARDGTGGSSAGSPCCSERNPSITP